MQSIQLTTLDVEALRTQLRKMSDEDLRKFGKAARYMVSPRANMGKPPLPTFVLQLEAARAEWRRRKVEPRRKQPRGGCFSNMSVVSSRRYKTREQAEKAREKYPERLRKRIGLGVIRIKR